MSEKRRPQFQREQAREHLTITTTMYRGMAVRFWLEKAAVETSRV